MGHLERALRDTFDAQVGRAPAVDDAAGRAIRRADRIRHRRTSAAVLAAAACVALIGAGIGQLSPRSAELPLLAPGSTDHIDTLGSLPIAVLDGARLVRADRSALPLGTPTARRAWQVSDGWIIETEAAAGAGLWFLPATGAAPVLLAEGGRVALAPDGRRVAWGAAGRISVATRTGGTLTGTVQTTGAGALLPMAFLGDGVLLGGPVEGATSDRYDMWFPGRGDYLPGPLTADRVLATTADGERGYALTPGTIPCVVLLVPDRLAREESVCDPVGAGLERIVPSPGGRWLALCYIDRIELYDEAAFWSLVPPAQVWHVSGSNLTWLDDESLVISTGTMLVRYAADQPDATATYALGPEPGGDPWIVPVPTLR